MAPNFWSSLIRLDYSTGTTPLDRLRTLAGAGPSLALVNWPNSTPYAFGWDGRDRYDYAALDEQLTSLLRVQPELRFLLSFGSLHGTPYYWSIDHREELAVFHCGRRMQQASLGSLLWRKDSAEAARRFAAHYASGPLSERIVGFHPFSTAVDWHGIGETLVNIPAHETPTGFSDPLEGDFSPAMREAFRAFLREKYGSDTALRDAWRDPAASAERAELPDRVAVRSPRPQVRDYFECYNRLNATLALSWCEALKAGAPDKTVLLGHGTVYGWPAQNIHPQGSGHNSPELLLQSTAVDALISPPTVALGSRCALSQHALGSLRLHGTQHVYSLEALSLASQSPAEQCAELTLAVGYAATQGSSLAWGEPRHGPGSMQDNRGQFAPLPYDHPEVRAQVARLDAWHAAHLSAGPAGVAEIAVFISPRGSHHRALETRFNRERIEPFRNQVLARAGLPFDDYLFSDFPKVAKNYRAWIFVDCPDIDDEAWSLVCAHPGISLFATLGEPLCKPSVLRDFASTAGVHIWSRTDDTLHADAKSLVFAAHSTGPKQIILPRPAIVRNALTDALIPCLGCQLEFSAKAGDVLLFDLLPA